MRRGALQGVLPVSRTLIMSTLPLFFRTLAVLVIIAGCSSSSGGQADGAACTAQCCSDSDCAICQSCTAGTCVAVKSQDHSSCAGTCDSGGACKSRQGQLCQEAPGGCLAGTTCVDGYCCNSACTASCVACDIAGSLGICVNVASGPPHGTHACSSIGQTCSAGACLWRDGEPCSVAVDCASDACNTFYPDIDQDGYGDPSMPTKLCGTNPVTGYVTDNRDCCDNGGGNVTVAALIHPNANPQTNSANGVCGITWDYDCDGHLQITPADISKCELPQCTSVPVGQLPDDQIAMYCGLLDSACGCSLSNPGGCLGGCGSGDTTFACR
jgi:hypothetical protein